MKLAPILLAAFCLPAWAGPCLNYGELVTLKGVLSRHTFPEQPNYESIANGDAAATYFFVSPGAPVCVAAGAGQSDEPAEPSVKRVQLVFPFGTNGYEPLRRYLGGQVVCAGSLVHAISGHHHSPVLLFEAQCHAA
jgi:hypothetical protein